MRTVEAPVKEPGTKTSPKVRPEVAPEPGIHPFPPERICPQQTREVGK